MPESRKHSRQRLFAILRIAFGVVWGIDAFFKWTPTFLNGLSGSIESMVQGQPSLVALWLNLWIHIISVNPYLFAIVVALAESTLALALILDLFPRTTLIFGFVFSLLIWSIGEGFGGPYTPGSTDIGTGIMYAFVFAALYFNKFAVDQ